MRATGLVPRVGRILLDDVYGWFERRERGVYGASEKGRVALATFAHVLEDLLLEDLLIEELADEKAAIPVAQC